MAKILIVEDEKVVALDIKNTLKALGYAVTGIASTGSEAVQMAVSTKPDLILMDILLNNKLEGIGAAEEICKLMDTPMVYLTAYADPETLKKAKITTPSGYILKPFDERELHINIEITLHRHEIERQLKASEAKYRGLVENAHDAVYLIALDGFEYVNSAFEKLSGYKACEVLNKDFNIWDTIHPDDRSLVREREAARKTGEKLSGSYEFRMLTKDGKVRQVEVNTVDISEQNELKVLGIVRDSTERKRAETEKARLEEQLRQSQKMEAVGILAGGIAHDFNNLLTAITGYTELLLSDPSVNELMRGDLGEIKKAAGRAASLTRQLLAFSRRQPLQPRVINLNDIAVNMGKMLRCLIDESIELNTLLEPGLHSVKADSSQIEQVIMNLAVNARDAMPDGGRLNIITENVEIDEGYCKLVPYARPGKFACLSVEDTGIGMDKATVARVFEPFYSTKGPGVGTGLGLSVVYGIVKQHNGLINIYSEPDNGSIFRVYLPNISILPENEPDENVPYEKLHGDGNRILLVEDEKAVRKFAVRALRERGYIVHKAADQQAARDIFKQENGNFDLVFSDVVLPDGNGIRLIEQLLAEKPELKALLTSGYTDHKSQWSVIREKKYHYLQKPYNLDELLLTVKKVLKPDLDLPEKKGKPVVIDY